MEVPIKVAPCPILHAANGGQFDGKGNPILVDGVRSKCDKAYDCGQCSYMQEYLNQKIEQGYSVHWECINCIKEQGTGVLSREEKNGKNRYLLGFYQAGKKKYPPEHPDHDPDNPALEGCTRCGWESSFLQLVLREP